MTDPKRMAFLLRRLADSKRLDDIQSHLIWEAAALIERQAEVDAAARVVCDEWRTMYDQSAIFDTTRTDGVRLSHAMHLLRAAIGKGKP